MRTFVDIALLTQAAAPDDAQVPPTVVLTIRFDPPRPSALVWVFAEEQRRIVPAQ